MAALLGDETGRLIRHVEEWLDERKY